MKVLDTNNNKLIWLTGGLVVVLLSIFAITTFGEYFSYESTKRKYDVVKTAVVKDWSNDQIQGLLNSKTNNK